MRQDQLRDVLCSVLREHLSGSRRRVPEAARTLWGVFVDLCGSRTYTIDGPNPITFAEIDAWARVHRWPLDRHAEILRALDDEWLRHARAKSGSAVPAGNGTPRAGQEINPAVFDAVFGYE